MTQKRRLPPGFGPNRKKAPLTPDEITAMALRADEPLEPLDDIEDRETKTLVAMVGDYFSKENPLSLYNQVPAGFQKTLDEMPAEKWESPKAQSQAMSNTTRVDRALRKALWAEYTVCTQRQERMDIRRMCEGVCSPGYFYAMANRQEKVLFLFTPPADYLSEMTSLQDLALVRMREILSLPVAGPDGKIDPKVMKLVLQTAAMVDARIHGAPKQSIEQTNRNANLNVSLTGSIDQKPQTMEEIEARLAEVTEKIQGKPVAELTEQPTPMESILNGMRGQSSKKGLTPELEAEYKKVKAAENE